MSFYDSTKSISRPSHEPPSSHQGSVSTHPAQLMPHDAINLLSDRMVAGCKVLCLGPPNQLHPYGRRWNTDMVLLPPRPCHQVIQLSGLEAEGGKSQASMYVIL